MGSTARKQLVRDIKREALRRMEDAAWTEKDFQNVIEQWDRLDENREQREKWNEPWRLAPLMPAAVPGNAVIPIPHDLVFWRQMMTGNFLDVIYACPYEMHELVEDRDVSLVLRGASDNHLEILWFLAVRLYSIERLAALRGCTERNIRKTRGLMLNNLRGNLAPRLQQRVDSGDLSVPWNMRDFLARYDKMQKAALDVKSGE